ncbi:berberine bridge enzyme-like 3 [Chenopodium quinoa]|uniref:berberine bridge enzyme-like 3 n=1 Tax=Chenopodium quinoa TaxID=63459 RepID=UPI000B776BB0|nr:berberine bridge enzyme-like 3 [Chenopodium quinoa]
MSEEEDLGRLGTFAGTSFSDYDNDEFILDYFNNFVFELKNWELVRWIGVEPQILFLFYLYSFFFGYNVKASYSNIDDFLDCLHYSSISNPSFPISNAIYTRSNPSFLKVLQAYIHESRFNTSSTPKPLAIVTALDVSHVQATVICAKENDVQIRIRSGGHDNEGLSYVAHVPFVILDMFNLRSIDIDIPSETAWVEAGATIGELYYKIGNTSKIHGFPAGLCFTVGAGGHFSGGGYGNMLRKYGLSIDNIVNALVVDVNGRILNRESMGEDLFWAITGGGAASFCVVISWKIKLVRVPKVVTFFDVARTLEEGVTDIVIQWQQVSSTINKKLFIRMQPMVSKQGGNTTIRISFLGLYLGRAKSLVTLINKEFPLLRLQKQDLNEMSWVESTVSYYIGNGNPLEVLLQRTPSPPHSYWKHKSDYVNSPIPREGLEKIWKKMIQLENHVIILQWNPYGGRMSEIKENATAFPHRSGYIFKMQYLVTWKDDSVEATSRNIEAIRDLHATFTPYVSNPRVAYWNYRDIDVGTNENGSLDFAMEFFKDNVKRLLHVKAKVDPHNFFRYEQSIPVIVS